MGTIHNIRVLGIAIDPGKTSASTNVGSFEANGLKTSSFSSVKGTFKRAIGPGEISHTSKFDNNGYTASIGAKWSILSLDASYSPTQAVTKVDIGVSLWSVSVPVMGQNQFFKSSCTLKVDAKGLYRDLTGPVYIPSPLYK